MTDTPMGFDAFVEKWVPAPPAWSSAAGEQGWREAGSEEARRQGYREQMTRLGPEVPVELETRLRRDAAEGVPLLDTLVWLLAEPGIADQAAAALLVQRLFGVPSTRARYISSWRPGNRSEEARRVLERVSLCIDDACRAGLWQAPGAHSG